jgi:hypothetical protein
MNMLAAAIHTSIMIHGWEYLPHLLAVSQVKLMQVVAAMHHSVCLLSYNSNKPMQVVAAMHHCAPLCDGLASAHSKGSAAALVNDWHCHCIGQCH